MRLNVNPVDSTNVQPIPKNSSEKLNEEIKVFPTADEVADVGLGVMAIHMRAAKYRNENKLPFGFSAVSDGYALGKGAAEQVEYNIEKVIHELEEQKDENKPSNLLRMLFRGLVFKSFNKFQQENQ